ncbi:unnamed protein product [Ceutorhynchus assimilis]|uniref:Uncharacterized protein n=1 Tax=Ceutorhynchus assimilis TaxID=467358 RepID=A0A9N9MR73_9CUCU|nr:unnamed protein product [Ceutorhynchus assimilis]
MAKVITFLVWLIILIFISFAVASFCAGFYILLLPLTVCIKGLKELTDLLLKGLQFPHYCATQMMSKGSQSGYLNI